MLFGIGIPSLAFLFSMQDYYVTIVKVRPSHYTLTLGIIIQTI